MFALNYNANMEQFKRLWNMKNGEKLMKIRYV